MFGSDGQAKPGFPHFADGAGDDGGDGDGGSDGDGDGGDDGHIGGGDEGGGDDAGGGDGVVWCDSDVVSHDAEQAVDAEKIHNKMYLL